jgi:hypothetical protein
MTICLNDRFSDWVASWGFTACVLWLWWFILSRIEVGPSSASVVVLTFTVGNTFLRNVGKILTEHSGHISDGTSLDRYRCENLRLYFLFGLRLVRQRNDQSTVSVTTKSSRHLKQRILSIIATPNLWVFISIKTPLIDCIYSMIWGSHSGGYACYIFHAGFLLGLFFEPEDTGDLFLRNVGWLSTDSTVLYPRRYYPLITFVQGSFSDDIKALKPL